MSEPETNRPWETAEDEPQRDILATEMLPEPGLAGVNPFASLLAGEVARMLAEVNRKRADEARSALPNAVVSGAATLTATAVGAVEGTLKGKSLEGALKEAQILALYAEARERNANAAKAEAEAEKIREETARERLLFVLETMRGLGIETHLAQLADGRIVVTLGDGLRDANSGAGG